MRIVVDMNLSTEWVSVLAGIGVEAVHWSSIANGDAPDEEIMAWAQAHDSVVLTRDLDFGAIVTLLGLRSPSVVQLRMKQVDVARDAPRVTRALSLQYAELGRGALVTIDRERVRVRRLATDDLL